MCENHRKSLIQIESNTKRFLTDFPVKSFLFQRISHISADFVNFLTIQKIQRDLSRVSQKKFQRVVSLSSHAYFRLDKCPLLSTHISIPDTGDNGPIWRWFFTLSNLFRLVVVVSLERLFILNFLGMQYTLGKVVKNDQKKSSKMLII